MFLIDDSGSMGGPKGNHARTALVLMMEVLKRLECPISVIKFSGRKQQKTLKSFSQHFDNQLGEMILSDFKFFGGTYPADALRYGLQEFLSAPKEKGVTYHRSIIMITDGISSQQNAEEYIEILKTFDVNEVPVKFSVMQILDSRTGEAEKKKIEQLLKTIIHRGQSEKGRDKALCLVQWDKVSELIPRLADMLLEIFREWFEEIKTAEKRYALSHPQELPVQFQDHPKPNEPQPFPDLTILSKDPVKEEILSSGFHSCLLPHANEVSGLAPLSFESEAVRQHCQKILEENASVLHRLTKSHGHFLEKASQIWSSFENLNGGLIEETKNSLQVLLETNKFTRYIPDYRGGSLDMKGVIRFEISNGNYRKIFRSRKAGGKRLYKICILLDVSSSMNGTICYESLSVLSLLISALHQLNLSKFLMVATFGSDIQILKRLESEWDSFSMYQVLTGCNVKFDSAQSFDGEALNKIFESFSCQLPEHPGYVFVLTDGFSSHPTQLTQSLRYASENRINVVALSCGHEDSNVSQHYQHWIRFRFSKNLPEALLTWTKNETTDECVTTEVFNIHNIPFDSRQIDKVWEISDQPLVPIYSDQEVDVVMTSGISTKTEIILEIAFTFDITGSMGSWLNATKQHIHSILQNIQDDITKLYSSARVTIRCALYPYRDLGDDIPPTQDFTTDRDLIKRVLDPLQVGGGGDTPEDVVRSLDATLTKFKWTPTTDTNRVAKFLILVADAPSHGLIYTGGVCDDSYPGGVPGEPTAQVLMERFKEKKVNFIFCEIQPRYTGKMLKVFQQYYDVGGDKIYVSNLTDAKASERFQKYS